MGRMRRALALLAAFGLVALEAASQGAPALRLTWGANRADIASRSHPAIQVYSDRAGLPQNSVVSLALDRQGYVWAGTFNGMARWNGRFWRTMELPAGYSGWTNQGAVLPATDGSMWFGTRQNGVEIFKDGHWSNILPKDGLPSDNISAILESRELGKDRKRVMWVATFGGGVARLEEGRWSAMDVRQGLASNRVFSLFEKQEPGGRRVLLAGTEEGVSVFQDGAWKPFPGNSRLPDKRIRCFAVTADIGDEESLWLAMEDGGLARWKGGRMTLFTATTGLPSNRVVTLLATLTEDGKPALWVGTGGGGLARWEQSPDGHDAFRVLNLDDGLPSNYIHGLAESKSEGGYPVLWVGTEGHGVARYVEGGWRSLAEPWQRENPRVQTIFETRGAHGESVTWLGGSTWGLARFEGGRWKTFSKKDGLPSENVTSLFAWPGKQNQDDLWVGTPEGLAHLQGQSWTRFTEKDGLPARTVRTIQGMQGHLLYVGTSRGIARWDGKTWHPMTTPPKDSVRELLEEPMLGGEPRLWVAADGGLEFFQDGHWNLIGPELGIAEPNMTSLMLDDQPGRPHRIWAGAYGGGLVMIEEAKQGFQFRHFNTKTDPALPDDVVGDVRSDALGRIYVFTSRGVARLTETKRGSSVETFGIEDGLPGLECLVGATAVDSDGRIWVGTMDGAAYLDPRRERMDLGGKPLLIERAYVGSSGNVLKEGDALSHDHDAVVFESALLVQHREADTRFRSQLVGLEKEPGPWNRFGRRAFPRLPAGKYTFKVWAKDYAGNISGPATFSFQVKAPWWKTLPAYLLYALILGGCFNLVSRLRSRVLRIRNEELSAQVAARTEEATQQKQALEDLNRHLVRLNLQKSEFMGIAAHDLKNPLQTISLNAELIEQHSHLPPEVLKSRAAKIKNTAQAMANLISRLLSEEAIETGQLALRIEPFDVVPIALEVVEAFRERASAKGLELRLEKSHEAIIAIADPRHVREVFDNLVSNAIKFSPTRKHVWIRLSHLPQLVLIQVEDEGQGISEEDKPKLFQRYTRLSAQPTQGESSTGLGLHIVKSLVEAMNGHIWVESEPGRGAAFCIELPSGNP